MTQSLIHPLDDRIDIHAVLAHRRQVAIVWETGDVREVRPDLSDDQAWEVLQGCLDWHDCELGFTWTLIEMVAHRLFPHAAAGSNG